MSVPTIAEQIDPDVLAKLASIAHGEVGGARDGGRIFAVDAQHGHAVDFGNVARVARRTSFSLIAFLFKIIIETNTTTMLTKGVVKPS